MLYVVHIHIHGIEFILTISESHPPVEHAARTSELIAFIWNNETNAWGFWIYLSLEMITYRLDQCQNADEGYEID